MFRKKKKGLVYFSRKELKLVFEDLPNVISLPLDSKMIENLESLNEELLSQELKKIHDKNKFDKHDIAIILNEDLVFSKTIDIGKDKSIDKAVMIRDFLDEIPLRNEVLKQKDYTRDKELILTATNHLLYEILIKLLKTYHCKVLGIFPEVILNLTELTKKEIDIIFSQKTLFETGSYVTVTRPKSLFRRIVEWIFWLLIVFGVCYGIYYLAATNKEFFPFVISKIIEFFNWLKNISADTLSSAIK